MDANLEKKISQYRDAQAKAFTLVRKVNKSDREMERLNALHDTQERLYGEMSRLCINLGLDLDTILENTPVLQ